MFNIKLKKYLLSNHIKLFLSLLFVGNSTLISNAYGILPVTEANSLLVNSRSSGNFTLTAIANNTQNNVYLDWSSGDSSNKTFKVYQKKPGATNFQSISSTDFDESKKVNVLNVYPPVGNSITFTTYDNKQYTLPKAASLKMWMESPTSYVDENGTTVNVPYGFGKGLITVTPLSITDFNVNPDLYLKNSDGSYKYDVIMFGSWDSNNGNDLSEISSNATKEFLDSGRGVLFGHDTMRTFACPNFTKLISYANLANYTGSYYNGVESSSGFGAGEFYPQISNIKIVRNGLLVNYPWIIGTIDTKLQVPASHNTQLSNGDIWMRYTHSTYTNDNMIDKNNFYLSTWNNTAMIQTGHSKGDATKDEQKLLANTLFYLNQLSTATNLTDNSGQDVTAPEKPSVKLLSSTSNQLKFDFSETKDLGSKYEYYVVAEDKDGTVSQSNTAVATVTSGIKGYSYVLDKNPNTEPSNNVNCTSSTLTLNNLENNTTYYLHIKAIDNANNVSEIRHYKISTVSPTAPVINTSRTGWGTTDVSFTISQKHNKNVNILSLSTHSTTPLVSRLKSLGYNVTSNSSLTNVEDILKYDVVVVDAYCWGVQNATLLKTLYDNGAKILTAGNDTSSSIYPILSTKNVGNINLTMNRLIKNEATFRLSTYNGGADGNSYTITSIINDASTWYSLSVDNSPYVINVENGNDGIWIHSQSQLGVTNNSQSDEFIMGTIDYLTKSISQFHIQDVQYKIDNGSWTSYNGETITISGEGSHTIYTRNIDNRGVVSSVTSSTVGIDRTAPTGKAYTNATTTSRSVTVILDTLADSLSGLSKARISNYSDFRDSSTYTSIDNVSSVTLKIEIPFFSDVNQNYSNRTIYVEIQDKVGNKRVLSCSTKYEPKNPSVTITSPTTNSLFRQTETISLSWEYNGLNNDNVVLPQSKAIVNVTKVDSSNSIPFAYTVDGESNNIIISDLDKGEYHVNVTVYNSFGKSSTSKDIIIRRDVYSTKGNLATKYISPGSPLKYISVLTEAELPSGTQVKGYIYYAKKESDSFSEDKKIEFSISNNQESSPVIKLPESSAKIMLKYELYNTTANKYISPALCNLIVLGK